MTAIQELENLGENQPESYDQYLDACGATELDMLVDRDLQGLRFVAKEIRKELA